MHQNSLKQTLSLAATDKVWMQIEQHAQLETYGHVPKIGCGVKICPNDPWQKLTGKILHGSHSTLVGKKGATGPRLAEAAK
jgi:hypothetical protein